jgi:malate dehydrogenase
MKRKKIALIGAGNIGGQLAFSAANLELGDVVLVDIPDKEGVARGKALDLMQAAMITGRDVTIAGTSDYAKIGHVDVCIVTAGVPRKPGMSRDDLLSINLKIIRDVATNIRQYAPDCFVIVLSNPLDAMVYEMRKVTGFPSNRVVGMAGVLDSARIRYFIADAYGCGVQEVNALVLGGHGDAMVPVLRYCTINGIPVTQLLDGKTLDAMVERTRFGGGEIVNLMGTSAFFAPAACAIAMAESYLKDRKRLLPCTAYLNGEYGFTDIYLGVPVLIGGGGVEKIIEIELTEEEKALLAKSAAGVQKLIDEAKKI